MQSWMRGVRKHTLLQRAKMLCAVKNDSTAMCESVSHSVEWPWPLFKGHGVISLYNLPVLQQGIPLMTLQYMTFWSKCNARAMLIWKKNKQTKHSHSFISKTLCTSVAYKNKDHKNIAVIFWFSHTYTYRIHLSCIITLTLLVTQVVLHTVYIHVLLHLHFCLSLFICTAHVLINVHVI